VRRFSLRSLYRERGGGWVQSGDSDSRDACRWPHQPAAGYYGAYMPRLDSSTPKSPLFNVFYPKKPEPTSVLWNNSLVLVAPMS